MAGEHPQLERLRPVLGAPDVGGRDPEHLVRGVTQARQVRFLAVSPHPAVVRQVSFLYSAVIGDVLALGVYTVQLKKNATELGFVARSS